MTRSSKEAKRTGREYLRVSYDRSGRERSQDEQHDDNQHAADGIDVTLGDPYREAGSTSASRYSRKLRDDFERLLADLDAGRFGADVLFLWESSRGSRKVGEWVTLIDLCEKQSVTIYVTTHGREYDPSNARDRRGLLEDAVDSEYESAKVSARATRAAAANARDGKPHGSVPFGYVRRYDERTRVMLAQEPHPEEAPLVRELFARLKGGHSFREIARDWAERGILNDSGRPFTAAHLRALAVNPSYTALRVHQPKKKGKRSRGAVLSGEGVTTTEGTWEPLVERADFLAVQRILSDPKRVTTRPGKARHFLSMIARCDVCSDVLIVTTRAVEAGEYQCRGAGHVRVRKEELDEIAQAAMVAYLARPDTYKALTAGDSQEHDDELKAIRADLATARHDLDKLRTDVGSGRLHVDSLVVAEPMMLARISKLEAAQQERETPSVLRGLIEPGEDVAERWEQTQTSTRRALARLLLTPEWLGELRVRPRPEGRRNVYVPADERVDFRTLTGGK